MKINFKRLVSKKEVSSIINSLVDEPLLIQDVNGKVLSGNILSNLAYKCPVELEGVVIGWVSGGEKTPAIASLLSYLANQEFEKKALGHETLEKYREITLLYEITEKLAVNHNLKDVRLVIDEVKRLIKADNISIMMVNEDTGLLEIMVASEEESHPKENIKAGQGIAGNILRSGKAEIVNNVLNDPRYVKGSAKVSSLMCAPLKIKDEVIGVINISSEGSINYSAQELKLLSAITLQAATAIENARLYDRLKETFHSLVHALAETIEKRDPYTGGHTKRVMNYSLAIGKELGLSDIETENLKLAAILHDIGKIGIRDNILLKSVGLTDEEYAVIKMHTVYGKEVLNHIKNLKDIIPGVLYHHERYDGKGYPEGLKGDEIDIIARIIAVADVFDAMTTDRPYRKALSLGTAIEELEKNAGTQFDPEVVNAFFSACKNDIMLTGELK